jgi:hypothetical protein
MCNQPQEVSQPSELQRKFLQRGRLYLESFVYGALLKGKRFEQWQRGVKHPEYQPTLCDAMRETSLITTLEGVLQEEASLSTAEAIRRRKARLEKDNQHQALARIMLVRAEPERQDELFGWEQTGFNQDVYWLKKIEESLLHHRRAK